MKEFRHLLLYLSEKKIKSLHALYSNTSTKMVVLFNRKLLI